MTTATLPTPSTPVWTDRKRYLWLLGAATVSLPFQGYFLAELTGWSVFWWFSPFFVYVIIPALDYLVGEDTENPPEEMVPALVQDKYYRYAVMAAIPIQIAVFVWGGYMAVHGGLNWFEWLGLLVSVGMTAGIAINTGHELGHQTDPVERWLAKLSLAPGCYGHFFVEHNRGHHVRVSTPEDPASSRFGENFYEYYPRCVIGSVRSAIEIEKTRLAKQNKSFWSWDNDLLNAWALTAVIWGAMIAWLGWIVLPFMVITAIYGGSLLEVVNYLEHYGLMRQKKPDGSYERCQPHHSWNSNHVVTNIFLYHLQRHSDHHAYPTRSYQTLRHFDGLPTLPSGYAAMIVLAYVPWLWFKIMDPKVVAHYQGDMRKANIKPSIRERIVAQFSPAA